MDKNCVCQILYCCRLKVYATKVLRVVKIVVTTVLLSLVKYTECSGTNMWKMSEVRKETCSVCNRNDDN